MQTIGLVGPMASGKGVVVRVLRDSGYLVFSLSDIVREEAVKQGAPNTRQGLQEVGDALREDFGPDILARKTVGKILKSGQEKTVIDSIRNPGEVEYLRKNLPIKIVAVVASQKKRFENIKKRGQSTDPKSWEEFLRDEKRDRGVGQDKYGQQVDKCVKMADFVVQNRGNLTEFEAQIAKVLAEVGV